MYVSSNVGEDMKMGLARLSNMLATVPNYDYADLSKDDPSKAPKLVDRPAENLLVVTAVGRRATTPRSRRRCRATSSGSRR